MFFRSEEYLRKLENAIRPGTRGARARRQKAELAKAFHDRTVANLMRSRPAPRSPEYVAKRRLQYEILRRHGPWEERGGYKQLLISEYAEAFPKSGLSQPVQRVKALIREAQKAGLLPRVYSNFEVDGDGEAVNIDIYGASPDGQLALVQVRHYYKGRRQAWSSTRKSYFVLGPGDGGLHRVEVSGRKVHAAIEKDDDPVSPLLAVASALPEPWRELLAGPRAPWSRQRDTSRGPIRKWTAYKLVRVEETGDFASPYDEAFRYHLNATSKQAVKPDHGGGLYVYDDPEALEEAFYGGRLLPERCYQPGKYAILECEVWGRVIEYGRKKAVSYVKPRRVYKEIVLDRNYLRQAN